jgi:hypothetical protein
MLKYTYEEYSNYTELSHSRETTSCAATQKFHNTLLKTKVRKTSPLFIILNHTNQVHTTPFHFSDTLFNIVQSPNFWSS